MNTIAAKVSSFAICLYYYKFSCPSSQGAVLASYDPHAYPACTNLQRYYTRPCYLSNLWPMPRLLCVTRGTLFRHTDILLRIFFCAPFPWNTDRTLAFTENTDICCYKKELLTLLVFLICNEINRLMNDFQDFRLSMRSFQQFLTWLIWFVLRRSALISPKTKKTKKQKNE